VLAILVLAVVNVTGHRHGVLLGLHFTAIQEV